MTIQANESAAPRGVAALSDRRSAESRMRPEMPPSDCSASNKQRNPRGVVRMVIRQRGIIPSCPNCREMDEDYFRILSNRLLTIGNNQKSPPKTDFADPVTCGQPLSQRSTAPGLISITRGGVLSPQLLSPHTGRRATRSDGPHGVHAQQRRNPPGGMPREGWRDWEHSVHARPRSDGRGIAGGS